MTLYPAYSVKMSHASIRTKASSSTRRIIVGLFSSVLTGASLSLVANSRECGRSGLGGNPPKPTVERCSGKSGKYTA